MKKFTTISGVAAPLPIPNIDTDQLAPKGLLTIVTREGLGEKLFLDVRYNEDGSAKPDFPLNLPEYKNAEIIVAGANFGCGSSREHAVWALVDFGVRCVIAPSFSDIFSANAAKNGLLVARLPQTDCDALCTYITSRAQPTLTVNLLEKTIETPQTRYSFSIDDYSKELLLAGRDEVDVTLSEEAAIAAYEEARIAREPWFAPVGPTP